MTDIDINVTLEEALRAVLDDYNETHTIITYDSPESRDLEIYYKGNKVINVEKLVLTGVEFMYEEIDNWQEYLEE